MASRDGRAPRQVTQESYQGKTIMSITSINPSLGAAAYEAYQPKVAQPKFDSNNVTLPKENVELSDNSKYMKQIHDAILVMPEIRIPIVEEIKARIKNNDYPIENHFNKALEKLKNQNLLSTY
jgi:hypothetical protein